MIEQWADWDELRVVLAIARAGSLTGAAKLLNASHPTVFRRINRIEKALGVRLFERAREGYKPTLAGEEMAAVAERLETEIDGLARHLAGQDLRPSGTVRITTTDTLLYGLLTPIFSEFRRRYPEIKLEVVADNALLNLTKRDADVAIRPSRDPPESLSVARSRTSPWRSTGIAIKLLWKAERLRNPTGITPDDSLSQHRLFRWLTTRGFVERSVYRANTFIGMLDAVRSGIGLAALPCYLGDREPMLVRVGEPIAELRSELWLLTHPDLRHAARIRAFLDFIADALQPLKPLFEGRCPVTDT